MNIDKILEDTTGPYPDNMAPADSNISYDSLFQDTYVPSLPRQIFAQIPTKYPTGSLFAVVADKTTKQILIKKRIVEVFPSQPIKTSITREAVYDIKRLFDKDADAMIVKMLRGFVNDEENTKCLEFLETNSTAAPLLVLSDTTNAESVLFELSKKVQDLVVEINSVRTKTFSAYAVIPYTHIGAIMALSEYAGGDEVDDAGLYVGKIGMTKYYINPDVNSTTCYVGLVDKKDPGRSSATFSEYNNQVYVAQDDVFGNDMIFISNRYAITTSPAHETGNEMMYKFTIS